MYQLLFKSFIRSKAVMTALLLYFVIGLISILIGKQFLQQQEQAIQTATKSQQEHIKRNAGYIKNDYGLLLYYLKFAYINQPKPITALAIGQRDVHSNIQFLTIRGLEAQLYDTDLYNPYNLLIGNFDLSFVLIFLFPLLIIAFSFNLYAQEKEGGTWSLLQIQTFAPFSFLLQKMSVRILTVLGLLVALLICAKLLIGIPFNKEFLSYAIQAVLYLLSWFAICLLIICLKKSTSVSALLSLSSWLLLCLLIPGMINNYITAKYPVPQAYSTLLKQRDGYHTKWDEDKQATMKSFFKAYPQFSGFEWKQSSFDYLWYYAMQQLGDEESKEDSKSLREKLADREKLSTLISYAFPPMHTQLQFNEVAESGLIQHFNFLDSTAKFHERKRLYFYPKIFGALKTDNERWDKQVPEFYRSSPKIKWLNAILPMIVFIVALTFTSMVLFKRKQY